MLLLLSGTFELHAQEMPLPGSEIVNQVEAFFQKLNEAENIEVHSNSVKVIVAPSPTFSLYPDQLLKEYRGRSVSLSHVLRNRGNVTSSFDLSIFNMAGDDFDLQQLEWNNRMKTISANGDTLHTTVTLGPGEQYSFSYAGLIGKEEEDRRIQSMIKIQAYSPDYGITLDNVDTVQVLLGANLDIVKEQIGTQDIQRGDTFTYSISGRNTGDVAALGRTVTIDGVAREKVVLTDSIPANLTFEEFLSFNKGTPIYQQAGAAKYEFSSTPPGDASVVNVVGIAFDSLGVNEDFRMLFDVRVNDNATGDIINIAEVSYKDPDGEVVTTAASNNVILDLPELDAEIDYFTDSNFDRTTGTSTIGQPLHLQANASACNTLRGTIERAIITIESKMTGDFEEFTATETGPNTGMFRIDQEVPTRDATQFAVVLGNEILETVEKDELEAVLTCDGLNQSGQGGSAVINAMVQVDPYGVIFDSETNEPVSGAEVRIIDVNGVTNGGNAGGLAQVRDVQGEEILDNIQTTNESGEYRFPYLLAGEYRIEVAPPEGYTFVSELSIDQLPSDRSLDSLASYGKSFSLTGDPKGIDVDIPVDPKSTGVLFVEKTVNKKEAEIGDFLYYTINIRSEAVNTVNNLTLTDNLPFGFEYEKGTAQLDGESIEDPEGGKGPELKFEIGDINPGSSMELIYKVHIGAGSERGNGINVAIARSDEAIVKVSNQAQVKVEVTGGVFSDEGLIIGNVFLDCDRDGMQDANETGVPGVRLYLENGNYIITDADGKYTFYGVKPNKHVLKIDNYSLPDGSELEAVDNRHANDPSSRFVDLKKGEMHRADFAVCNCTEGVLNNIDTRKEAFGAGRNEVLNDVSKNFNLREQRTSNNRQAAGVVGDAKVPKIQSAKEAADAKTASPDSTSIITEDSTVVALDNMEMGLLNASADLGFLNVADGDTLDARQFTFQAKGKLGARFEMKVNGEIIENDKIGQRSAAKNRDLQAWEFVSIELNKGKNTVQLRERDPFGNLRDSVEVSVYAPGELKKLKVTVPENHVSADGVSAAVVRVEVLDQEGIRIGSKIDITLDASLGEWQVEDNQPKTPGTQTSVVGGVTDFKLKSTIEPKTVLVRANAGVLEGEAKVHFIPDLRPLIAAGIIEGTVRLRNPLDIRSASSDDGFERELKSLSYDMNNFTADGRISFFLKGKVSGKTLLTAGFDSEKDKENRMFRDIRPDEFYPVYGESSVKGFDAQSSSRLYIRVDRNKTYAMYGDFITQERDQDRQLGDYSRSQTGIKTHYEQDNYEVNAFGVSSASTHRLREFRGQGISRYELPDQDIIENSEIVEIVTYDRNQPEVILDVERLTRFRDYAIEPFNGAITFRAPVSSVDKEFNPQFIRITYEVENDDERYFIGGVDGKLRVVDGVVAGASYVKDNNPEEEFALTSGNLSVELNEDTRMLVEVARTNTARNGNGNAGRIELQKRGKKVDLLAQVGKAEKNFDNERATLGQGRTEAKVRGRYRFEGSTNINGEFLYSRNDTSGAEVVGGVLNVQRSLGSSINAEVGIRHTQESRAASEEIVNTNARGKITADLPFIEGASTYGEYEQDMTNTDRKMIAVGGDYRLRNIAKLYAKHEFISSAGGRYTLSSSAKRNNTLVGLDVNYMNNGQIYSEYRMADALDGRTGQAAIGVRNQFELKEGLGLNVGFERIYTVEGTPTNDGTALSTAIDYTANPNWKGTAKLEARFRKQSTTYLNSFGYGHKINRDWTFLGKNIIALTATDGVSGFSKIQQRLRVGTAFRDVDSNKLDALFRYEFKYEEDANIAPNHFRSAHVFSSHANYHPVVDWTFTGRLAAKRSVEQDEFLKSSSFLELLSGRTMYDITDRWDASINASLLANSDFTIKDYGVGIEAGYLVAKNLRLAAGFNLFGYEDEDLSENNYTQRGVYAGLSYKFDEQIFRSLAPERSKNILDESRYLICKEECGPKLTILPFHIPALDPYRLSIAEVESNYKRIEQLYFLPKQIHFNNDSTYITARSAQMLDMVATFLQSEGDYTIRITGHTDSKSSYDYNLDLSERRARAVRSYLIASGISGDKLRFEGLSYSQEIRQEKDQVDMAVNRRVELAINPEPFRARLVDQVEDLQVHPVVRGVDTWDYVFMAGHNQVPAAFNITSPELNGVQEYMANRIAMVLEDHAGLEMEIASADTIFASRIAEYLIREGVEEDRLAVTESENDSAAVFSFSDLERVEVYAQQDDIRFEKNSRVLAMMNNLLEVLQSRKDERLTEGFDRNNALPMNMDFDATAMTLSPEQKAVLARIGSFMKKYPKAKLQIQYNSSLEKGELRAEAIQTFLTDWGIESGRTYTNGSDDVPVDQLQFVYPDMQHIRLVDLDGAFKNGEDSK
ncbi:conserved repeat domain-containing protein [Gracilimonas mengyeensis]|uniref:Conserved repeat domain-containing protein n=1 Tax=Gracilimonas mengyeensis TaxID=1302730 RepID=A0A521FKQ9_9BACT|nr:conserved repeat domain-containing protein [Gracilimonas mengyeensis]